MLLSGFYDESRMETDAEPPWGEVSTDLQHLKPSAPEVAGASALGVRNNSEQAMTLFAGRWWLNREISETSSRMV